MVHDDALFRLIGEDKRKQSGRNCGRSRKRRKQYDGGASGSKAVLIIVHFKVASTLFERNHPLPEVHLPT
jgi:hypothetical protein